MTDTSMPSTRISVSSPGSSYVEWSAIFAGAMLTSAIIVLMTAFGSAIGLSLVSPYHGPSPTIFYIVLALWFTCITVSSFVAGGYVTGRLRRPIDGTTPHEVHVRDGAHGLVVWAIAGSSARRSRRSRFHPLSRHCPFHPRSKAAPISQNRAPPPWRQASDSVLIRSAMRSTRCYGTMEVPQRAEAPRWLIA
jgi:hypothetical protein